MNDVSEFSSHELRVARQQLNVSRQGGHCIWVSPAIAYLLDREVTSIVGAPWVVQLALLNIVATDD